MALLGKSAMAALGAAAQDAGRQFDPRFRSQQMMEDILRVAQIKQAIDEAKARQAAEAQAGASLAHTQAQTALLGQQMEQAKQVAAEQQRGQQDVGRYAEQMAPLLAQNFQTEALTSDAANVASGIWQRLGEVVQAGREQKKGGIVEKLTPQVYGGISQRLQQVSPKPMQKLVPRPGAWQKPGGQIDVYSTAYRGTKESLTPILRDALMRDPSLLGEITKISQEQKRRVGQESISRGQQELGEQKIGLEEKSLGLRDREIKLMADDRMREADERKDRLAFDQWRTIWELTNQAEQFNKRLEQDVGEYEFKRRNEGRDAISQQIAALPDAIALAMIDNDAERERAIAATNAERDRLVKLLDAETKKLIGGSPSVTTKAEQTPDKQKVFNGAVDAYKSSGGSRAAVAKYLLSYGVKLNDDVFNQIKQKAKSSGKAK